MLSNNRNTVLFTKSIKYVILTVALTLCMGEYASAKLFGNEEPAYKKLEKKLIGKWWSSGEESSTSSDGGEWPSLAVLNSGNIEFGDFEVTLGSNKRFTMWRYPKKREVSKERDENGREREVETVIYEARGVWEVLPDSSIKVEFKSTSRGVFFPGEKNSGGGKVTVEGNRMIGWFGRVYYRKTDEK